MQCICIQICVICFNKIIDSNTGSSVVSSTKCLLENNRMTFEKEDIKVLIQINLLCNKLNST